MIDDAWDNTIRVTDLKQWAYCRRIFYYLHCLPSMRPTTFLMSLGTEKGLEVEALERRRSLRAYGLKEGQREFSVDLVSAALGLRGTVDMVIFTEEQGHPPIIPVEFKNSSSVAMHYKLQVMAYACLLEEQYKTRLDYGYIYMIPGKKSVKVKFTSHLRNTLQREMAQIHKITAFETMPDPCKQPGRCLACEFRRFCNDVI